jgi:hypothetical protein
MIATAAKAQPRSRSYNQVSLIRTRAPILRLPRERAQLRCREVPAQRYWNRHDEPPSFATNELEQPDLGIVNESQSMRHGIRLVQFVSRLKPNQKIPINVLLTAIVADRAIDVVRVRGLAGGSSPNWSISIMSSVAMRLLRANTASVSATRAFCFGAAGFWAADPAGCSVIGCCCGSGA